VSINYPFAELTLNYTKPPIVNISNNGSYSEMIPVSCEIYDEIGNLVYTDNGASYLNPLQSTTITLTTSWTPSDTGFYNIYFFTQVPDDYFPQNDTMETQTNITTELLYDDGFLDVYGYVSTNYYENKFAEKLIPCLSPPYYITRARFYVSSADPIAMSLNSDSAGLPGLGPSYYIAPAETIYPGSTGWAVRQYPTPIQIDNPDPFWIVVHWLSSSPYTPYIGMDKTTPLDSLSYWYWSESSNPGWHQWTLYDFMMRVYTTHQEGVETRNTTSPARFIMQPPRPNPFVKQIKISFSIPITGIFKLGVYDVSGRLVTKISDGIKPSGEYSINWDGFDNNSRKVSSGVYFLKADYEKQSLVRKLILIGN
jgi:hypothetical protein